jgi:hypothetical protein
MTTGIHALHPPGQPAAVEMVPTIYSPRSELLKHPYNLYRSGARFCSKDRRITLLSGAARMPIKRKAAQPYFKANSHKDVKSKIKNQKSKIKNQKSKIRKLISS